MSLMMSKPKHYLPFVALLFLEFVFSGVLPHADHGAQVFESMQVDIER
jgi:hypothetical protein